MYAIVDIETTGGYAENHRITEVAIYLHDGIAGNRGISYADKSGKEHSHTISPD